MGLTWVFEIVTFYFRCESSECLWLELPVDLLVSIFPGFSIFVVSVCNTRVLTLLKERFYSRQKGYKKGSSISSRFVNSARSERSMSSKKSSISLKFVTTQKWMFKLEIPSGKLTKKTWKMDETYFLCMPRSLKRLRSWYALFDCY